MENILVPVSPGELLDKISILEIKSERMTQTQQLAHVRAELALLHGIRVRSLSAGKELQALLHELKEVNRKLWDVENAIRAKERAGAFDAVFIELARSVYLTNDRRSQIKKELNRLLGSQITEEKSYTGY